MFLSNQFTSPWSWETIEAGFNGMIVFLFIRVINSLLCSFVVIHEPASIKGPILKTSSE